MKSSRVLFIFLSLFAIQPAIAVTNDISFDKDSFMKEGLVLLTSSLETNLKDMGLASDPDCPESGIEVVEKVASKEGKLFNAMETVDALMTSVKPNVEQTQADVSRCGACQQKNVVSYLASISPEKIKPSTACEAMPAKTFTENLDGKEEIKSYTEKILQGTNSEGKALAESCPSPCAYYVTTSQTELSNGKTHLTLTVQCGHPRKDSVLSAVYEFQGGLVHQWVCTK